MATRLQDAGTLLGDALYVDRGADRELLEALRGGQFAWVLAPRQIGKSSLKRRVAERLQQEGFGIVDLDLNEMAAEGADAKSWYFGLMDEVSRSLDMEAPDAFWAAHERLSPTHRWSRWVRERLAPSLERQAVVFIDEIDTTLRLPFSRDDFFASIRAFYDDRREMPALDRISFCFLGVASPAELMRDPQRTPFNVGVAVRLADFTVEEMKGFLPAFASFGDAEGLLGRLYAWTSGHPYMSQRLARRLVETSSDDVDGVVRELFLARGRTEDPNLSYALKRLSRPETRDRHAEQWALYSRLLAGERVPARGDDEAQVELRLAGMAAEGVEADGQRVLRVRNLIYRRVFDEAWLQALQRDRFLFEAVHTWVGRGRPADLLLRGELLGEALERARGRADLTRVEREFLEASRAWADAERLRETERRAQIRGQRLLLGLALALILGLASVVGTYVYKEGQLGGFQALASRAEQAANQAEARLAEAERLTQEERQRVEALRRQAEEASLDKERTTRELDAATAAFRRQEAETLRALGRTREARERAEGLEIRNRETEQALESSREDLAEAARRLYDAAGRLAGTEGAEIDALRGALLGWDLLEAQDIDPDPQVLAEAIQARRAFSALGQGGWTRLAAEHAPDGASIVACEMGSPLSLLDLRSGQPRWEFDLDDLDSLAFSPDGSRLAGALPGGEVFVLDAGTGQPIRRFVPEPGHAHTLPMAPFSPDGSQILLKDRRGAALWEVASGKRLLTLEEEASRLGELAFSPDGRLVASAVDGEVRLRAPQDGALLGSASCPASRPHHLTFSHDGAWLAFSCLRTVLLHDVARARTAPLEAHLDDVRSLAFSDDGRWLASAGQDGAVRLWDVKTGRALLALLSDRWSASSARFSPDGRLLATCGDEDVVRLWDPSTGALLRTLPTMSRWVRSTAFFEDGRYLSVAALEAPDLVWDLWRGTQRARVTAEPGRSMLWAALAPGGEDLYTLDGDGLPALRSRDGALLRLPATLADFSGRLRLSPDGRTLLLAHGTGSISLADLEGRAPSRVLASFGTLGGNPFSADASRVTLGQDQGIQVFDVRSGERVGAFSCARGKVVDAALSPDGRRALAVCAGQGITIWDVDARAALRSLDDPSVLRATWAPDGQLIAAAMGSAILLFDPRTSRETPLLGHSSYVQALAFSPDGRRLVSASDDATARVWDAGTGATLDVLRGHTLKLWFAAFSQDGSELVTASADGTARVWTLSPSLPQGREALLYEACRLILPFSDDFATVASLCDARLAAPPPEGWP